MGDTQRLDVSAPPARLLGGSAAFHTPLEVVGDTLYLRTDLEAPRQRVVALDLGGGPTRLDDGRRVFGTVLIRAGTGTSGRTDIYGPIFIQHGAEVSLTRVAYIKFATRLDKPKNNRPRRPRRPRGSVPRGA